MKRLALILLLTILWIPSHARSRAPLIRYSVEWGGIQTLYEAGHINYVADEGYRVDDKYNGFSSHFNGYFQASAGIYFASKWCASVGIGFAGLPQGDRMVPVTLKLAFYPKTSRQDGIFFFADGGCGMKRNPCFLSSIGAGWRVAFNCRQSVDFSLGVNYVLDHPDITDPDTGGTIKASNIRKDNAISCSLGIGIALNF